MPGIEELQNQIEELRVRVAALAKGVGLQIGSKGFRIGKLRLFQHPAAAGDDRLYQEEPDGTTTDLTAAGTGGAPANADYLVGTANPNLSNEIAVGASPGGELSGTWASPTVEGTHSGSAHHAESHNVASHNDTTATGTELETLTDGSNADALHAHAATAFDSTPANDTASGVTCEFQAGEQADYGEVVYMASDKMVNLCDADAEATSRCIAICAESGNVANEATGTFLLHGFIEHEFNFTDPDDIGKKVFLSVTEGAVSVTAPSATDDCIVVIGIVMAADCLYFDPSVQAIVKHK